MRGESLYRRMPAPVQDLMCSFYGWKERRIRMGPAFWSRYHWLLKTETSSADEIAAYQDDQVSRLVRHAYETVPYYRRLMDARGMVPSDFRTRADLSAFPVLRKQDVIDSFQDLVSTTFPSRMTRLGATSGTTGTPLRFLTTKDAIGFQWAVWWRHRRRFGVDPGTLHVNFTGKRVVPIESSSGRYWRWNFPMRQALVNMQHLTPAKIGDIARFVGSHAFEFYSGYPSIIAAFCGQVERSSIELPHRPRLVFMGAENAQPLQLDVISRVTGAVLTDQYGVSEGCGNASRCEFGTYHEDWEFGVLECASSMRGEGGVSGPVLATGFSNYAFPLIRYEIGDRATWKPTDYQCPCGRQSRTIESIDGRLEDYVVTPEGARIMRFDYLFKDLQGVREAQVLQDVAGEIRIRLAIGPEFGPDTERYLREGVASWISPKMKVEIETVDLIPRNANGKFRPVVSTLKAAGPAAPIGMRMTGQEPS